MTRKDEIEKQLNDLRKEHKAIIADEDKIICESFIGKCFVTSENYDGEHDWVYYNKVVGYDNGAICEIFNIDPDYHGSYNFSPRVKYCDLPLGDQEITIEEYDKAFAKFILYIDSQRLKNCTALRGE